MLKNGLAMRFAKQNGNDRRGIHDDFHDGCSLVVHLNN
jgi:hypothetical protein